MSSISHCRTSWPWLLLAKSPCVLELCPSPDGELGAAGPYPCAAACCTHTNAALKLSVETTRTGTRCAGMLQP